ncbi:MAG: molybdopterin cofactor-binding domain-containing protein, partial [Methylobacterium sp.]
MSNVVQSVVQSVVKKAIELAPDAWMPGGKPDPLGRQKHGLVGASVSRIDGPLKVQGDARFAAEFALEGLVFASVRYSTIPKGRIASLDTARAEAAPGVVLVMTHRNAPRMKPMPLFGSAQKAAGGNDLPILQDNRIHWNGQPVALVLAHTQEEADHAASLIALDYAPEPATTSFEAAKAKGTEPATFMGQPLGVAIGDAEAALAKAAHRVDQVYRTPRHNPNPIEPHAATLLWEGETLRVHDATQAVSHTAWSLAQVFGIEEDEVHVTSPFVGGGFGSKTLWEHQVLGAAAAKLAGCPVRIALSREGVYRIVGGRTLTEQRVAIGTDED